jgi:hypothetical protein
MRPTLPRRASCSANLPERNRLLARPNGKFRIRRRLRSRWGRSSTPFHILDEAAARLRGLRRASPDPAPGQAFDVYDLTLVFFPFAPHDDLIDACARIYDMKPVAPSAWERAEWVAPVYPDA